MQNKIDLEKPTIITFMAESCVWKDTTIHNFMSNTPNSQQIYNVMTRPLRETDDKNYCKSISEKEYLRMKNNNEFVSYTDNTYKKDDNTTETIYYWSPKENLLPKHIYLWYSTRKSLEESPIDTNLYNVFRFMLYLSDELERIKRASKRTKEELLSTLRISNDSDDKKYTSPYNALSFAKFIQSETDKFLAKRKWFDNEVKNLRTNSEFLSKHNIVLIDASSSVEETVSQIKNHIWL